MARIRRRTTILLGNRCLMLVYNANHYILVMPGYKSRSMWKYDTRTGQRIEIDVQYTKPSEFWNPYIEAVGKNIMFILIDAENLSVAFFQPKSIREKDELESNDIAMLYVVGDKVYVFHNQSEHIVVIDKETGNQIQRKRARDSLHNQRCSEYSRHRNCVFLHNSLDARNMQGPSSPDFREFDISRNQFIRRSWMRNVRLFNPLMMQCSTDSRYMIVIDGASRMRCVTCIVVFDFKMRKSSLLKGIFTKAIQGAVIMNNDRTMDEFLTFGFVNRLWREPAFRNLQSMPRYLTQMISKWYCNEEVYITDDDGALYSIKADEIIGCYHEQEECPDDWMDKFNNKDVRESTDNQREQMSIEWSVD